MKLTIDMAQGLQTPDSTAHAAAKVGAMIGSTLLNYRVGAQLGAGGLGTVYAGEHTMIGRKAALKVLNPAVAQDESMVARFLAEARAVNAIRHPNIVDVTDYGKDEGVFVIVMELLEGETLAQRLETKGRLEERATISMLTQAASALGAAHERGIVHRDLKPENLFLTAYPDYPDFVKVLDFGIAKLSGAHGAGIKTSPGLIIGTPAYMSPEQCTGDEHLDFRSDIYSFGVVAYRMLTGRLPYEGNAMQMMHGHMGRPLPPPRTVEASISLDTERVLLRCLERDPAARFGSMNDLRRALVSLGGRAPIAFSADELSHHAPLQVVEPPAPDAPASAPTPVLRAPTISRLPTFEEEAAEHAQAVAVAAKMKDIIRARLMKDTLKFPAMPEVAMKALEVAHNPDSTFSAIARVVERDPFIASRLVRVSNSPRYGGMVRITSLDTAVSRLGTKTVISLVQELAAEEVFTSKDPTIRNAFRGIWEHCLGVANLARDLSGKIKSLNPNTAYLSGLFHDIGKPMVAALLLETERGKPHDKDWLSGGVWRKVIDECHRDVGAFIAFRWFLPQEVAASIAQLDTYDLRRGRGSCANVVRLANALCQREGLDVKAPPEAQIQRTVLQGRQVLGFSEDELNEACAGLAARVQAVTNANAEVEQSSTRVFDRTAN
jgi:putative nucleotidyltransferase with HDIG domain